MRGDVLIGDLCLLSWRHALAFRVCVVRRKYVFAGVTMVQGVLLDGVSVDVPEVAVIVIAPYRVAWSDGELAVAQWFARKMGEAQS